MADKKQKFKLSSIFTDSFKAKFSKEYKVILSLLAGGLVLLILHHLISPVAPIIALIIFSVYFFLQQKKKHELREKEILEIEKSQDNT